MEEISFEELRKVHLQEKHSSMLIPVAENFFDTYTDYLLRFYNELKQGFSIEEAKVFENARKVFAELVRLRGQKILLKAFKDARTNSVSTDGLTTQEKTLYLTMLKNFNEYEKTLFPPTRRENTSSPIPTEQTPDKTTQVEITTDLPEFVSPTGKTLGPFSKGSVVEIDEETAEILKRKRHAKTT